MKKVLNFGSLLLILALVSVGCGKDPKMERLDQEEYSVRFSLRRPQVKESIELITKADDPNMPDANDFNVRIFGQTLRGTSYDTAWAKYSDMPPVIPIPAGNYTVEAFNGEQKTGLNSPYYYGATKLSVGIQDVIEADIVCQLACVKVSVEFTPLFKSNVANSICLIRSLTDENFLEIQEKDSGVPGYIAVPSDGKLYVTIRGTYVENDSLVNYTEPLLEVKAKQWHKIQLSVNTAGAIENNGELVEVDYSTEEKDFDVQVPGGNDVIDNNGDQGSWDDDEPEVPAVPEEPGKEMIVIAGVDFNIDEELSVSGNEMSVVDIQIDAEKSIDKLEVEISSPVLSSELLGSVGLSDHFDIANPDEQLKKNLIELGILKEGDEIKGKTSHVFSVGNFMPALGFIGGIGYKNCFKLTVTDAAGNVMEKTLTVNLTE